MKIRLLILAICISAAVSAQNDTIIYFSNLYKPVQTEADAALSETLTKTADDQYVLKNSYKSNGKWKRFPGTKIKRQSDSSFVMTSSTEVIRYYHKVDSGYFIRDASDPNSRFFINQAGFSKRLFPIIKSGVWKTYFPQTGNLQFEDTYSNNQLISNKYWINDTTFIKNVFKTFDVAPHFHGGENALSDLIQDNIVYPSEAKNRGIEGSVMVGFVIMYDGRIAGARVESIVDKSLAAEALRVVSLTYKKWTPGRIEDKNVNTFVHIPIIFKLH